MQRYRVYGVTLATDLPLSWPVPVADVGLEPADVTFTCQPEAPIEVDWAAHPPIYSANLVSADGATDIAYHALPGVDVIRVRGAADHYVYPERIVCHVDEPELAWLLEIHLLGMVLALWLERYVGPTLHASSAAVDGRAVAFLGIKGGGKTTAVTGMVAGGHELLVDDLLALEIRAGCVLAQPGYPLLRLWPEQADHFVGGHDQLPLVHPAYEKRRVDVGELGDFHPNAAELARVYLPQRTSDAETVQIAPVRSSDALISLLTHSFLAEQVHGLGLAPQRLAALAGALSMVEVRSLRYPDGFERLPDLVRAVEADLATP